MRDAKRIPPAQSEMPVSEGETKGGERELKILLNAKGGRRRITDREEKGLGTTADRQVATLSKVQRGAKGKCFSALVGGGRPKK